MKKQISAEIIADSINGCGERITTFVLTFPRFILAELNTHRVFSRNSASSRAIPFKKMVEEVMEDPFMPMAYQEDHSGMQGHKYLPTMYQERFCPNTWLRGRDAAVEHATYLNKQLGASKQLANRMLEPYLWHTAIVTATDFENFFALRCPQYSLYKETYRSRVSLETAYMMNGMSTIDWLELNKGEGEIHIMELAEKMYDAYSDNEPKFLQDGEWHIPFGDKFDEAKIICELYDQGLKYVGPGEIDSAKIKIATARCARVSYLNFHGKDDYAADIKLYDRLSSSGHWSPFEHCAKAMSFSERDNNLVIQDGVVTPGVSGNFRGYIQLRKTFANENIT